MFPVDDDMAPTGNNPPPLPDVMTVTSTDSDDASFISFEDLGSDLHEFTLHQLDLVPDDCSVQTIDSLDLMFDPDDFADATSDEFLCSEPPVPLSDHQYLDLCITQLDRRHTALYRHDLYVRTLGTTRIQHYTHLRSTHPHLTCRAHADGGSMASTTDQLQYLWHYRAVPNIDVVLRVADSRGHQPTGIGYLKVPALNDYGWLFTECYYTPSMPTTIISPHAIASANCCTGHTLVSDFHDDHNCSLRLHHRLRRSQDLHVPLTLMRGLLYTSPLLPPVTDADRTGPRPSPCLHADPVDPTLPVYRVATDPVSPVPADAPLDAPTLLMLQRLGYPTDVHLAQVCISCDGIPDGLVSTPLAPSAPDHPEPCSTPGVSACSTGVSACSSIPLTNETCQYTVNHLSRDQLRLLWHQRLGHLHFRRIQDAHKTADGIPIIASASKLQQCPICARAKLRRADRTQVDSRHATLCNQGISVDTGFIVQQSKSSDCYLRSVGLNGENQYCLITDHATGALYVRCFSHK
jgi:GAG-pre-integrase domain